MYTIELSRAGLRFWGLPASSCQVPVATLSTGARCRLSGGPGIDMILRMTDDLVNEEL